MANLQAATLTIPTNVEGTVTPVTYDLKDATARAGAVELVKDTAGWTGKNRLRNNRNTVTTENTVVYTKNADDSVTIGTQTASGDSYYRFYIGDLNLPNGVYTVTKGVDNENIRLGIDKRDANEQYIGRYGTATYEKTITFEYNDAGTYYPEPWIEIENGKSLSAEVTVFPMLCDADIYNLSPAYEPHHDTVEAELAKKANTADVAAIAAVIPSSATSSNKVATAEDVTASVDLLKDTTGWTGKNKADSSKATTYGTNIFTYNSSDKTVTANGTGGTNNSQYSIPLNVSGDFYFLGCPDGGAVDKYDIYIYDGTTGARVKQWDGVTQSVSNYGSTPCQAQIPEGHIVTMNLRVFDGFTVDSIVFKPMLITKEDYDLSPAYEPYHESVEEYAFPRSEQVILGAENLLRVKSTTNTSTMTQVRNADDSVTLNGTNTEASGLVAFALRNDNNYFLPKGRYRLFVKTDKAYTGRIVANVNATIGGSSVLLGSGDCNTPFEFEVASDSYPLGVYLSPYNNSACDNVTFYALLTLATDTNTVYQKPTLTNRELTDAVTPKKLEETSTSEQAARITVPTSFHIAYAFVSIDSDKTFHCVIAKGISSRAFRFTYKASSNTEVRGYIWYDYTNSRIEVGSFMVNDVEMKNDTNIKLEVFYI